VLAQFGGVCFTHLVENRVLHVNTYLTLFAFACLSLASCSGHQIASAPLAHKIPGSSVEPIESRSVAGTRQVSSKRLSVLNSKAGAPSFGLIKSFYQLPISAPVGAAEFEEGYFFGQPYRSIRLEGMDAKPYAVLPASAAEAQVMESSISRFLDAGIRFAEVSMADALEIMKAEKNAIEKKGRIVLSHSVPSGVDLLISIQKGHGPMGSVYMGRVIDTRDGRLWALSTQPDMDVYALSPLVADLVEDTLTRMAKNPSKAR